MVLRLVDLITFQGYSEGAGLPVLCLRFEWNDQASRQTAAGSQFRNRSRPDLLGVVLCYDRRADPSPQFLLGLAVFTGIAYLLDPLFHHIGFAVLTAPALEGLWTTLYQSVWWRLEHFNNSIVMGSLVFSMALFVPVLLLSNMLIRRYRQHVLAWVQKTRIMQMFKASKLYQTYETLSAWRNG